MRNFYTYPAIFTQEAEGVAIEFPDLPGCLPCATSLETAIENATEAMHLHIYSMENDGDEMPEPTSISEIQFGANEVVALIHAWMPPFRELMALKGIAAEG